MSSNLPATTDDGPDLFSDARIQLIRDSIAKDAPDTVFRAMIEVARVRGLDPLAKQISVIKFKDAWQVMTTIDGYRAIAESTGTYAGSDEAQFGPALEPLRNGKRPPEWASVTVWKFAHGQRVPFSARVYWDEYYGGNFTWDKMPRTMLAKVAESHALRKGFPKVLSGLYTNEEMDQAGPGIDQSSHIRRDEIVDAETGEVIARARAIRNTAQTRQDAPQATKELPAWDQAFYAAKRADIDPESLYEYFAVRGYPDGHAPDVIALKFARWCEAHNRREIQQHIRDTIAASQDPPAPADQGMDDADYQGVMDSIAVEAKERSQAELAAAWRGDA